MRLRSRIVAALLAVVGVGIAATLAMIAGATGRVFRVYVFEGDRDKARVYAGLLGEYWEERGSWEGVQRFLEEMPRVVAAGLGSSLRNAARPDGPDPEAQAPATDEERAAVDALLLDRIVLADASGRIVGDSSALLLDSIHPPRHLAGGLAIYPPGARASDARVGTVLVGSMIDSSLSDKAEAFLRGTMAALALAALAPALLAVFLGLGLAIGLARPLDQLAHASGLLAAGDFSARVDLAASTSWPDELRSLGASFNAMALELERLEEARRRLIADAAHELRTPVTLIRGGLEAMLDGIYPRTDESLRSVHAETLRLSVLIDALRELEQIDSGKLTLNRLGFDARELIDRIAVAFRQEASAAGMRIETRGPELRLGLVADPIRLEEALRAIVDNALKYGSGGDDARLLLSVEGHGDRVRFIVEDSGQGIRPEDRERIFERFHRLGQSRASDKGGQGLGLSIAREIARAHGGELSCDASADLGGAAFILELPVSAPTGSNPSSRRVSV
jgi:signal transduction histidine kinase